MAKTIEYHQDLVLYNQIMADAAKMAESEVGDPEVKKICRRFVQQHQYHASAHQKKIDGLRQFMLSEARRTRKIATEIVNEVFSEPVSAVIEISDTEQVEVSKVQIMSLGATEDSRLDAIIEEAQA